MLSILFTIVLGVNTYSVVNNCADQGGVYFPKDDSKENRVLSLCLDTVTDEVVQHELMHVCMHDHKHSYPDKQALSIHLDYETYTEEYFAAVVSPCLVDNQAKLYEALKDHGINIHRDVESDRSGIDSRKDNSETSQSNVIYKRTYCLCSRSPKEIQINQ